MSSRRLPVATVLVCALALAACGGSDDDGAGDSTLPGDVTVPATEPVATDPPATDPPATEPPATEPVATEPPATDPPSTEPPATEAPAGTVVAPATSPGEESGPDCLVGDWVITEAEMNAYYDALEAAFGATGPAPTFAVSGQVLLSFTATDYTYVGDFDLTLGLAGQEGTGASTGTVSGTWSATDGVITSEITSSDLTVSVTVGGLTLDGSDLANGLLSDAPINSAPYDCAGPTLGFQTGEGTPRHTVTLTPA